MFLSFSCGYRCMSFIKIRNQNITDSAAVCDFILNPESTINTSDCNDIKKNSLSNAIIPSSLLPIYQIEKSNKASTILLFTT